MPADFRNMLNSLSSVIPMKIGIQTVWNWAMKQIKSPTVYILASHRNGTLYIGVTSNLSKPMAEHTLAFVDGFTKKHCIKTLVYHDRFMNMDETIGREKQPKEWRRAWKIQLIEDMNPEWVDLYNNTTGEILNGPAESERLTSEPVRDFE